MGAADETGGQLLTRRELLAQQVDNAFISATVLVARLLLIVVFIMSRHKE